MSFNPVFSTSRRNSRVNMNPSTSRSIVRTPIHSLHAENRASKSPNRLIEYEKMIHDMKNSLLNDLEEKMKEMNRPEGFQYEQIIPVLEQMGETVDMYEKKIQDKLKDYAHNVLSQERQSHRTSYINLIEILKGIRVSLEACLKQAKSNINNEIQTEPFEEIKNAIKEYRINRTRNEKKNMFNSLKKRSNSLKLARAEGKRKAPPATQLLLNRIGHNMNTIRKQFENGDKSRLRALEKKKMINAMREKSKRRRPTNVLLNKILRNMSNLDKRLKSR